MVSWKISGGLVAFAVGVTGLSPMPAHASAPAATTPPPATAMPATALPDGLPAAELPAGSAPAPVTPAAALPAAATARYVIPARYLQPVTSIPKPKGAGFKLKAGWNGAKVAKVQRKLGLRGRQETMDWTTRSRVKAFQRRHHLKATGVVDYRTWRKMGFSKASWTALDSYRAPVRVKPGATRSQYVEAFVATALSYRGSPYVWGGSNTRSVGADCSGLVLQAMYSTGLNPAPITTVKHAGPTLNTAQAFYSHPRLKHVPLAQRKRGDLVFYGKPGRITHVAIYLGKGKMAEAVRPKVRVSAYRSARALPTVVRPFP